jgi:hypothetical protein
MLTITFANIEYFKSCLAKAWLRVVDPLLFDFLYSVLFFFSAFCDQLDKVRRIEPRAHKGPYGLLIEPIHIVIIMILRMWLAGKAKEISTGLD